MTAATLQKHLRYPTSKRTNSLGWAQSDCHTCSSLKRACDRRRPRCDACTADEIVCGGYVQKLDWRRASRSKPPLIHQVSVTSSIVEKPAAFTFVQESGTTSDPPLKRRKSQPSSASSDESPTVSNASLEASKGSKSHSLALSRKSASASPVLVKSIFNVYQLPQSVLELVSFYESRFSYVTLTYKVKVNPWHACLAMVYDRSCVMDAVTAVAKRQRSHLLHKSEDVEVLELKDRALSSFSAELNRSSVDTLISTTLALIGLEYTETAYSDWFVHLSGAYKVMEARGGIALARNNPTLRSQIAMLVWYDITSALLSRSGPIFPRSYTEALVDWQVDSEWSLLSLNGCPDVVFLDVHDIALAAAHIDEMTSEDKQQLELRLWKATADDSADPDVAGLVDAWGIGLLLYCARIFHPHDTGAEARRTLAEEILWLMSALPPKSTCQKQTLLPVLLASCELTADQPRFRSMAVDFCSRWSQSTGVWVFKSASDLLDRIWKTMDANPDNKDIWWGSIITPGSSRGYLFG